MDHGTESGNIRTWTERLVISGEFIQHFTGAGWIRGFLGDGLWSVPVGGLTMTESELGVFMQGLMRLSDCEQVQVISIPDRGIVEWWCGFWLAPDTLGIATMAYVLYFLREYHWSYWLQNWHAVSQCHGVGAGRQTSRVQKAPIYGFNHK